MTAQAQTPGIASTAAAALPQELVEQIVRAQEDAEMEAGTSSIIRKLRSWDFYRSMGSPKFVVAPMVDQSELAWRVLSRIHGSTLCYTPMIHAGLYSQASNTRYHREQFDLLSGEEGSFPLDRPVIAQFCANDKETFLAAASKLAEELEGDPQRRRRVCAVDLNLGCPQGIAKRGGYGAFLMEDWELISSLISHLHERLHVPITAKFRVYDSLAQTLAYAAMLEKAGAQILTVHGRTREQKGQATGLADWDKIKAVKAAAGVPVFANGNILDWRDVQRCLDHTGVDGVMSAEGNLYNPGLFLPLNRPGAVSYGASLPPAFRNALDAVDAQYKPAKEDDAYLPITQLSLQYIAIVQQLKTQTGLSAVKSHLFRMWKPIFSHDEKYHEIRDRLSRMSTLVEGGKAENWKQQVESFRELSNELANMLDTDFKDGRLPHDPREALPETWDAPLPYSHVQPYLRPLSETDASKIAGGKRGLNSDDTDLDDHAKRAKGGNAATSSIALLPEKILCPVCSTNMASNRCVRKVCKHCCLKAMSEAKEGEAEPDVCEDHAAKARKEEEKRAAKRQRVEVRRSAKKSKGGDTAKGPPKAPGHAQEQQEQQMPVEVA